MKHLRYLLVALFAFIVSLALTPIGFNVKGWGCGHVVDGGGGFSSTAYSSSYSVRLSFAHFGFNSKEKANEVFDQHFASVFWTEGRTLHSIDSPSLLHVLEFEKGILGEWRLGVRRIQYLFASDHL